MQESLQKIVSSWKIKNGAEHRTYRCAKCQRLIRKAYQYLLSNKNFKVFVHLCKNCNKLYFFPKTKLEKFKCDKCLRIVFKSWHIWSIKNNQKSEKHLCKKCYNLVNEI